LALYLLGIETRNSNQPKSKYDAQKAYAELQEHHLKSTKTSVKILGYITSAKIGDGSWHGTAENFILNWQEQILCMSGSHLPVGTSQMNKLTMLQTAVHPLQELCQVKATAALLKVHTKKDLDYDAYSSLLFSTASDYDSNHSVSKGKRQVYSHDLDHGDDDLYDASYETDPFDIDTPVDTIQAFTAKFTPRPGMNDKVHMPKDKWFGLDQKTKDLCNIPWLSMHGLLRDLPGTVEIVFLAYNNAVYHRISVQDQY
jgi:hypothetical protein